MRTSFFLLAFVSASALAQSGLPFVQAFEPLDPKKNQKVERIHIEDSAVKIDEVRYAGQAQSITVQPKDGLPTYEIQPATPSRERVDDGRKPVGGERVWNVFNF